MKSCIGCVHADWKKTEKGNLHPSGDGRCKYPYVVPPLPASMYWISKSGPCGGYINRKDAASDCVYREVKP